MKFQISAVALASIFALSSGANSNVQLVKDIYPGKNSSNPIGLTLYGGDAYFAADDMSTGVEPYLSDGTSRGTRMLMDINPGPGSSNPAGFTEFKSELYFQANDGSTGVELWVTDGTMFDTKLFKDINSGSASSNPSNFVVLGNRMIFAATTKSYGRELWVTDGTPDGTMLMYDIYPGTTGSNLDLRPEYRVGNNKTIFTADNGSNGESLYVTDGTVSGTIMLKDLSSDPQSVVISRPVKQSVDQIFFTFGTELWVTDGTQSGTKVVDQDVIIGGPSRISPYNLNGDTLFFGHKTGETDDSLYKTDGTSSGTEVLVNGLQPAAVSRGAASTFGLGFGPVISDMLAVMTDNGIGVNIWVTDGKSLTPLVEATFDWVLDVQLSMDGKQALFLIKNGTSLELWTSDYTSLNTVMVDTFPGGIASSSVGNALIFNTTDALFPVGTPSYGVELWAMEFPKLKVLSPTRAPHSPTRSPTKPSAPSPTTTSATAPMASFTFGATLVCAILALIV